MDWFKVVETSGIIEDFNIIKKREEKQMKIRELELVGYSEKLVDD